MSDLDQANARITELLSRIEAYKVENAELKAKNTELKEAVRKVTEDLSYKLENTVSEIEVLKEKLDEKTNICMCLQAELKESEELKYKYEAQVKSCEETIQNLQNTYDIVATGFNNVEERCKCEQEKNAELIHTLVNLSNVLQNFSFNSIKDNQNPLSEFISKNEEVNSNAENK